MYSTGILTILKLHSITDYLKMYTKQTFSTSLRRIWKKNRFWLSWQNSKFNTKIFWVRTVTDKERRAAQKIKYFKLSQTQMFQSSVHQCTHWENSKWVGLLILGQYGCLWCHGNNFEYYTQEKFWKSLTYSNFFSHSIFKVLL